MLTANIEAYNQFSNGTVELSGNVYADKNTVELSYIELNKLCNQLNLIIKLKDDDTGEEYIFPALENTNV